MAATVHVGGIGIAVPPKTIKKCWALLCLGFRATRKRYEVCAPGSLLLMLMVSALSASCYATDALGGLDRLIPFLSMPQFGI